MMIGRKYIKSFIETRNLNDETQIKIEFYLNGFFDYLEDIEDKKESSEVKYRWEILDFR